MPVRIFQLGDLRIIKEKLEEKFETCIVLLEEFNLLQDLQQTCAGFRAYYLTYCQGGMELAGEDHEEVAEIHRSIVRQMNRARHIAASFLRTRGIHLFGMCTRYWPCDCQPEIASPYPGAECEREIFRMPS